MPSPVLSYPTCKMGRRAPASGTCCGRRPSGGLRRARGSSSGSAVKGERAGKEAPRSRDAAPHPPRTAAAAANAEPRPTRAAAAAAGSGAPSPGSPGPGPRVSPPRPGGGPGRGRDGGGPGSPRPAAKTQRGRAGQEGAGNGRGPGGWGRRLALAALRAGDGGAAQTPASGVGRGRGSGGGGGLGSHPPTWVGVPCWTHPEEGARRNGRVLSISGEGPGPDTHQEEALRSSEEGSGGPATLNRGGSDVLASPGTARIPPSLVPDPPRNRAPPRHAVGRPLVAPPPTAPQDLRTRWESTGRSLRPADALVPAVGRLGFGKIPCVHTCTHTHRHQLRT